MEDVIPDDHRPDQVEERPTLKTLARLTGLAVPTISRALSDAPDIGEDTKRRVKEMAARIGYRPNRAGVRLRTGRTNVRRRSASALRWRGSCQNAPLIS